MQSFDSIRQLKNGNMYDTTVSTIMTNSPESSPVTNASECKVEDEPEARILTQVEVIEQIRFHIAPLTKQLEDLTRLIQGMSTAQQLNSYPRAGTSGNFSAAGYLPDSHEFGYCDLFIRSTRQQMNWLSSNN